MERNLSIDLLKMGLAVSIVFLHTMIFYDFSKLLGHSLVQGVFRLAVPLFLIITGYYFFYIQSFEKYKKWLTRITLLYLLWTVLYLPIWWSESVFYNFLSIFFGYFVLWYLVGVLLGASLLYFLKKLSSKVLFTCAFIFFLTGFLLQELGNFHLLNGFLDKILNFYPLHRNFLFVSFPFLTLGFLINKHQGKISTLLFSIKFKYVIFAIGFVILESLLNYFFVSKKEALDQMLSLFFAAPLLFLYVLKQYIPGQSKQLAHLSTAIFLIHPFFIYHLKSHFMGQQTWFSVVVLSCSIVAGWLLVQLNRKVKYLL